MSGPIFTPGEWYEDEAGIFSKTGGVIPKETPICVFPYQPYDAAGEVELAANAAVITAGPALYHQLAGLRRLFEIVCDKLDIDLDETLIDISAVSPTGSRTIASRPLRSALDLTDTVLSKARGEPPHPNVVTPPNAESVK